MCAFNCKFARELYHIYVCYYHDSGDSRDWSEIVHILEISENNLTINFT